jgi:hypothetical protein
LAHVPLPSQYGALAVLPQEQRAARVSCSSTPGPVTCRSPRRRIGPPSFAVTVVGLICVSLVEVMG